MTWNAIYSVLFSLIAIGLYITFRFKRWQWASGATAALAFNALLIIGIFSMFYGLLPFNLEVNQAFIAAILTIIGVPSTTRWSSSTESASTWVSTRSAT